MERVYKVHKVYKVYKVTGVLRTVFNGSLRYRGQSAPQGSIYFMNFINLINFINPKARAADNLKSKIIKSKIELRCFYAAQ